jgi:hypothetical protein
MAGVFCEGRGGSTYQLVIKKMKIIAWIYLVIVVLNTICIPFLFGKSRGEYTPTYFLVYGLFNAPLAYLFYRVINL